MDSFLGRLYKQLHARALAMRGQEQKAALKGGAVLSVCIDADGTTTVRFARPSKKLGETELATFRVHCAIPAHATRQPHIGQTSETRDDMTWYIVAYSWKGAKVAATADCTSL